MTPTTKPADRDIIYSKDVQRYTGKGTETARRMLRKVRKQLGKNSRDMVTVDEFCEVFHFSGERVRSILRMPVLFFIIHYSIVVLFRDDLDLLFLWFLVWTCLAYEIATFGRFSQKLRSFLLSGDVIHNSPK